jgi:hypothetical protein
MSSPIHTARCVARRDDSVDIELEPTTACGPHFPLSSFFALSLLYECGTSIVYRSPGNVLRWSDARTPIGVAIDQDELFELMSKPADDPRKRVLTNAFIRSASYVLARNWTPGRDDLDDVFERAVDEGTALPSAILRIDTADAQWVSHVERGMQWDVYVFDDDAPSWPIQI